MSTSKPVANQSCLPKWDIDDRDGIAAGRDPRQIHFPFFEPFVVAEPEQTLTRSGALRNLTAGENE